MELRLAGLQSPDPLGMSFAQLWTHWRILRGMEARRAVWDVHTTLLGSRAKPGDVTKFLKQMGADRG